MWTRMFNVKNKRTRTIGGENSVALFFGHTEGSCSVPTTLRPRALHFRGSNIVPSSSLHANVGSKPRKEG